MSTTARAVSLLALVCSLGCDGPAAAVDAASATDAAALPDAYSAATDAGPPDAPRGDAGPVVVAPFECETSSTITRGEPITAPAGEWTFVPFPDAHCMDGSSTGIGVNLSDTSDRVLVFLEGGGACFDLITCLGVANPNGFDEEDLTAIALRLGRGVFDRTSAENPLADWDMVFVPYCTGDVHMGSALDGSGYEGRTQAGYANIGEFLERLVPTFDGATQVLLTGSSAGGFGALGNYDQVQRAFGCTPVDLMDDSGQILDDAYLGTCLQTKIRETWNISAAIPSDCPQCSLPDGGGLASIHHYLALKYGDTRFALVSSTQDATIRNFYGYGRAEACDFPESYPPEDFERGVLSLRDDLLAPHANWQTFITAGDTHTFLQRDLESTVTGGVTLAEWIRRLVEDDAAWTDVGP